MQQVDQTGKLSMYMECKDTTYALLILIAHPKHQLGRGRQPCCVRCAMSPSWVVCSGGATSQCLLRPPQPLFFSRNATQDARSPHRRLFWEGQPEQQSDMVGSKSPPCIVLLSAYSGFPYLETTPRPEPSSIWSYTVTHHSLHKPLWPPYQTTHKYSKFIYDVYKWYLYRNGRVVLPTH